MIASSALSMMVLIASADLGNGVRASFQPNINHFHAFPVDESLSNKHQYQHRSFSVTSLSSSSNPSAQSQDHQPQQEPHQPPPSPLSPPIPVATVSQATSTLQHYDSLQQTYIRENPIVGDGIAALRFLQSKLTPNDRATIRTAVQILASAAQYERGLDNSGKGRVMLGFCAENVPEALLGLKTWVPNLGLPRGLLHGLDVDGVEVEIDGCVYVKYNSGGSMTFSEMRESGLGFDALWKPGDAVLQTYDGDFRGVYFNVELADGEFRQFGILPTDLFVEEEEW